MRGLPEPGGCSTLSRVKVRIRRRDLVWGIGVAVLLLSGCGSRSKKADSAADHLGDVPNSSLALKSLVFSHENPIPAKYSCEGDDVSPPLEWSGVPEGTESFALVIDDPDAPDPAKPERVWVHWVVFNIPAGVTEFEEGAATSLPSGTRTGQTDMDRPGYGGPCPMIGRHRYFIKLYALDEKLDLKNPTKAELEAAMASHVLGAAELIGTYKSQMVE